MAWRGMARYGAVWRGMAWHGLPCEQQSFYKSSFSGHSWGQLLNLRRVRMSRGGSFPPTFASFELLALRSKRKSGDFRCLLRDFVGFCNFLYRHFEEMYVRWIKFRKFLLLPLEKKRKGGKNSNYLPDWLKATTYHACFLQIDKHLLEAKSDHQTQHPITHYFFHLPSILSLRVGLYADSQSWYIACRRQFSQKGQRNRETIRFLATWPIRRSERSNGKNGGT